MREFAISTDVYISAPPQVVWGVLIETDSYPEWNPLVRSIEGEIVLGSEVRATFEPLPGRTTRSTVTIDELDVGRTFGWRGRLGNERLLCGRHRYRLKGDGDGCHVTNVETFTGLLLPIARRLLDRTRPGYVANNEALKSRAESRHARTRLG